MHVQVLIKAIDSFDSDKIISIGNNVDFAAFTLGNFCSNYLIVNYPAEFDSHFTYKPTYFEGKYKVSNLIMDQTLQSVMESISQNIPEKQKLHYIFQITYSKTWANDSFFRTCRSIGKSMINLVWLSH